MRWVSKPRIEEYTQLTAMFKLKLLIRMIMPQRTSITLHISDINDNAPVFHQASYVVHVVENNAPGVSIAQVSSSNPDLGPNGSVSYSILASDLEPRELLSYVSVSAQNRVVLMQHAFDHEQLRTFELTLQARDQGSPVLSANVSLRMLLGDLNDNVPRVLYPALGPDGSVLFDMVPRSSEPGYLVTKAVVVNADSGHNIWLSYHVLQASEPRLFSARVCTARALDDRDVARQRLLVAVRDGGQPPLSATATLHLIFTDNLQEVLPDLSDRLEPSDPQAELQFYLVVALISVLFFLAVILAIALRLRHSSSFDTEGWFQTEVVLKLSKAERKGCERLLSRYKSRKESSALTGSEHAYWLGLNGLTHTVFAAVEGHTQHSKNPLLPGHTRQPLCWSLSGRT
ncbi:LOW QUALITY PROTEIN: Protocadherin gamma-B1 [Plecturocebus cupreus]